MPRQTKTKWTLPHAPGAHTPCAATRTVPDRAPDRPRHTTPAVTHTQTSCRGRARTSGRPSVPRAHLRARRACAPARRRPMGDIWG
eukprot:5126687-Prymnesium_polylepis.1